MDESSALRLSFAIRAISPIQSGAPMTSFLPPPAHPQSYTWKRSHSSLSAVSFGFIAAAALISVCLVVAIFETWLRRPSLRTNPVNDRNSDDRQPAASGFSVKREGPTIEGITRVSVLMPGQANPPITVV